MKFTYVATCQNYGNQKRSGDRHGTDILNLMVKYVSLQFSGTFLQIYFFYVLGSLVHLSENLNPTVSYLAIHPSV